MDKEIKQEFEGLARIVKGEFDIVHKEISDLKKEMNEHFDTIESQIGDMRNEIKQIWNKLEEIEQKLGKISQASKEDIDAMAGDILGLKQKVGFLENQIKGLQEV